ncbi:PaaI family thioesterase [Sphingomonas morindae]|uniref:PaaI family thioesterase n=1 Tax=Sphingomonas morindae TaxID=1541170 RepID=A0ABY4XA85_9SPHN|nr:PaaI family thioesterase [Sphingomonas morindae]USI73610.1 PaaI family thioesterase [Sphingomonas morindae]
MTDAALEPDGEGFVGWRSPREDFNAVFGLIRARVEGERVRCRVETGPARANGMDMIHGGFMLAFLDQVLFVAPQALGRVRIGEAVTLAQSSQFLDAGRIDQPLDAVVEILRETGRLLFLRGVMEQEGRLLLSFEGTLRKFSAPRG